MSQHPLVLGYHFLLELVALVAFGYWGWTQHAGVGRWLWTIGLPVVAAVAWALLRAPGDGPDATIAIPGIARLALELLVLGGAAFLLWRAGQPLAAGAFAVLIVIDYILQFDRVGRLISA
ncbi:MAG TPA: YrdB family protein [Candidatus Angelobacter sp.]|nr:YrdB family protein [Candidatus Angelobacter sp.]